MQLLYVAMRMLTCCSESERQDLTKAFESDHHLELVAKSMLKTLGTLFTARSAIMM